VGVGWHGGHCFVCDPCRSGDFVTCRNEKITGITHDGGYADYVVVPHEAVAAIPDELSAMDAAPLLCAGITTFNALRHTGALAGDLVAVQGVGGLGHLGVQYAKQLGFRVAALSRGDDKRDLALELGADHYIDTDAENPAEALQQLGGARVILATAPSAKAIESVIGGLGRNGVLLIVAAASTPIAVPAMALIGGRTSVQGWPSGTAKDSEETLAFSALSGVRPMIETFPLEEAGKAYDRMLANDARFRVVLDIAGSR
jgi:alcohol dehydrogenase/propanol-preferring alcohol dehydrogenase